MAWYNYLSQWPSKKEKEIYKGAKRSNIQSSKSCIQQILYPGQTRYDSDICAIFDICPYRIVSNIQKYWTQVVLIYTQTPDLEFLVWISNLIRNFRVYFQSKKLKYVGI